MSTTSAEYLSHGGGGGGGRRGAERYEMLRWMAEQGRVGWEGRTLLGAMSAEHRAIMPASILPSLSARTVGRKTRSAYLSTFSLSWAYKYKQK